MKHTPAPWSLVEKPHEKMVSSWHIQVGEHLIPVHPYKRIYSEDRTQSGLVIDKEHMADAHLIAAAPELLAALMAIVKSLADQDDEGMIEHAQQMIDARAAIAKAGGAA